jgi:hypothetical protein
LLAKTLHTSTCVTAREWWELDSGNHHQMAASFSRFQVGKLQECYVISRVEVNNCLLWFELW